jgi:hypothetical protein
MSVQEGGNVNVSERNKMDRRHAEAFRSLENNIHEASIFANAVRKELCEEPTSELALVPTIILAERLEQLDKSYATRWHG